MFSYALSTASTYFHLPVDEEEDRDIENYERKYLTWTAEPSGLPVTDKSYPTLHSADPGRDDTLKEVLKNDDLYKVLGIAKAANLDKVALRRAYLSRSRACHPDKFPSEANATLAFQKVAVAYDILSKPSSKRLYDSRPPSSTYDVFSAHPAGHAEETFRSVVIGVFNDFLDGDLEVIRTLLKAINDINPALSLREDGINSVLLTLQRIRQRALSMNPSELTFIDSNPVVACRTCIYVLHNELCRLLEIQHALRQLSYFDLFGRSRLTVRLARITLRLPIAVEKAITDQNIAYGATDADHAAAAILPSKVTLLIRGVDVALARMEKIL
ncbi:DnaJ-domain-containing protein [Guyanagaster necrorhizus]|uniref:DnaJ-domain-containing protein n=1 Tax=Guyanagaster necrorhizus TaxID=856835 RepID=A0A9P7W2F2_9AGAR|nr:DnaJ-domain-containing protein [Guyanagaster necrorhizus MCA 3950]KAG7450942.1 DnaJ-domain-containing protein [Guyanagaster necrorhizus MCA 3950]